MNFKIKKNVLMEALNNVSKALSTKNIIPILSGIKFDLFKDKLVLTASDNDISIQTVIEQDENLEIKNTGSIVIKGKYILDIIRKLEAEFINLEIVDDHKIMIYTENSKFNLNGIDSKEYPNIEFLSSPDFLTIDVNKFKSLISQTNYACSLDEARLVLTGVNVKTFDNVLECSATDSYRLALKRLNIERGVNNDVDIIIPSRNLNELLKILPFEVDSDVEMHIFSNKVIFKFSNILFQSRLINGTYPNTKNLIPVDNLFSIMVNKNEFFNMVDRASILNNDRDNNVITLDISDGVLKITSMSLEIGKVEETMAINSLDNIRISFSGRYMMDALKNLTSENVVLTFVGEIKPILLKEEDNSDLIYLILPIRTY